MNTIIEGEVTAESPSERGLRWTPARGEVTAEESLQARSPLDSGQVRSLLSSSFQGWLLRVCLPLALLAALGFSIGLGVALLPAQKYSVEVTIVVRIPDTAERPRSAESAPRSRWSPLVPSWSSSPPRRRWTSLRTRSRTGSTSSGLRAPR